MRKRVGVCLLAVCACLFMTACGSAAETTETTIARDNLIHLYQVEGSQVTTSQSDVQLKTPDVLSSCVEDVMTALVDVENSSIASYSYMIGEDNSLQLELSLKEGSYEKEDMLLLMAAAAETLFQIDDLEMVDLSVKDAQGELLEKQECLPDTFYFYGYTQRDLTEKNVLVYQPNEQKTALTPVVVKETESPQISEQELIVSELVKQGILPKNTKVNQVSVYGDVCYLDLSGEFLYDIGNCTPEQVLYALVNSVIKQTGVTSVQLLVDGKIENTYRNAVDISRPVTFNADIIEQEP